MNPSISGNQSCLKEVLDPWPIVRCHLYPRQLEDHEGNYSIYPISHLISAIVIHLGVYSSGIIVADTLSSFKSRAMILRFCNYEGFSSVTMMMFHMIASSESDHTLYQNGWNACRSGHWGTRMILRNSFIAHYAAFYCVLVPIVSQITSNHSSPVILGRGKKEWNTCAQHKDNCDWGSDDPWILM